MNPSHNKTIEAITIHTPMGCMGEFPHYTARLERSGALSYHGMRNVSRLGTHRGSVSSLSFDMLGSLIETSGFLDLDQHGTVHSTAGETEIELETLSGSSSFWRDLFDTCPLFWAVETLACVLIERADWGDDAYSAAITDPKDLPEPLHIIEAALNLDRRVLPESATKRYLRAHRIQPPEPNGPGNWIAYRFDDSSYIEYHRDSLSYTSCSDGNRVAYRDFAELVSCFVVPSGG